MCCNYLQVNTCEVSVSVDQYSSWSGPELDNIQYKQHEKSYGIKISRSKALIRFENFIIL